MNKIVFFIGTFFLFLFLNGCSDNHISFIHSKILAKEEINCMRLSLFPPKESIQKKFLFLYPFEKNCNKELMVSYKESIVCNSSQNAQKKALGMAKSYLRLELKKENILVYSYYIDLADSIGEEDIENGFSVMESTLPLRAK